MSKKLTISEIENAFLPSREISSADRFAGRAKEVETAYFALHSEGTNIAIIGNRGIGKTSLARQVLNMASGNNDILEKVGMSYDEELDFIPIYFACGKSVSNYQELIEQLLTTRECLHDWIYDIPAAKKEIKSLEGKIDIKVASAGGNKQYETESSAAITAHSLDTVFVNVLTAISKEEVTRNGILIVIDEFDQISDPSGFASLLKSLATNAPTVKFCIVGVAHDISNLMKEHASTDRLFAGSIINLPAMTDDELCNIIDIAEASIDHQITFTDVGATKLVALAQGHPYMVHLLGKYALRSAFLSKGAEIDASDIDSTLQKVASSGVDPVLEGRYKKAI
ncbi:MAG: ATP-binding protein [Chloroflexi bacterium]|nr:ATP-binding protein [Chloroflexota bacterium]